MKYKKIIAMLTMSTLIFAGASGCMTTTLAAESADAEETTLDAVTTLSQIDNTKWSFSRFYLCQCGLQRTRRWRTCRCDRSEGCGSLYSL
jgi:hypothetical protein